MKCLFITTEFPPGPGGIGMHAYNVINELNKQFDVQFHVVLTENYNSTNEELNKFRESYMFPIYSLKNAPTVIKLIRNIYLLSNYALKYKPNVIITSGKHATWYGACLKFIFRKKLICFAHGSEFGTKSKKEIKINNWSYSYVDELISVSEYTLKYIREHTKINCKKSIVINNGADQNLFYHINSKKIQDFKRKNNLLNKNILLTLGNVSERKGQWVVIKALPSILEKYPNTFYYCIGNPSEEKRFNKMAQELGVASNVIFTGVKPNNELRFWLNSADVFIMSSTHTSYGDFEGFGISVIEAALCATPAIVTKGNNGVIESIKEGFTGFGIIEKDHVDLSNKINLLLSDEKLRKQLGDNAKERALKKFTWKIKANKIYNVINQK